jgi:nucleoside recognition membrane protein YjiH
MIKFMLSPYVLVGMALLWIAFLAKKGNRVSSIAKSASSTPVSYWPAVTIFAVLMTTGIVMIARTDGLNQMVAMFGTLCVAAIGIVAFIVLSAVDALKTAAPTAAKIGEEMTPLQKLSMLRRGRRLYRRFRSW